MIDKLRYYVHKSKYILLNEGLVSFISRLKKQVVKKIKKKFEKKHNVAVTLYPTLPVLFDAENTTLRLTIINRDNHIPFSFATKLADALGASLRMITQEALLLSAPRLTVSAHDIFMVAIREDLAIIKEISGGRNYVYEKNWETSLPDVIAKIEKDMEHAHVSL